MIFAVLERRLIQLLIKWLQFFINNKKIWDAKKISKKFIRKRYNRNPIEKMVAAWMIYSTVMSDLPLYT